MSYPDMLRLVRCAPLDDPLFKGETGRYFHAVMKTKRHECSPEARVKYHDTIGY